MNPRKKEKSKGSPRISPEDRKKERIISFIVFGFAFLLYANTLNFGYVLDDDVVYLKNRLVQEGISGIKEIFSHSFIYGFTGHNDQSYRPMVQVVYAIEKSMFGNSPHAQHFVNVLLFALSCLLLYHLLKKMLFPYVARHAGNVALGAALLFAAHPVHTEAVADIKGLDEILNFLFLILSLLFAFRYFSPEKGKVAETKHLLISALFFFFSLLCKEIAVTFLVIIPLTLVVFTDVPWKRVLGRTIPFFLAFLVYFMIRRAVLDVVTFEEPMKVVNNALAAAQTGSDRLATALFMMGKYILLLFFPHPLSWDYSYNQIPIVGFTDVKVIVTCISILALGIFAGIRILKSFGQPSVGGRPSSAIYAYCILFFFITLSIVSNIFILIGATMADRFLYTPSFGFCIALALALMQLGNKVNGKTVASIPSAALVPFAAIVLLFSIKTFSRNRDWENNFTLFTSGAEASPNSSRAVSALGSAYREQAEKEPDPAKRLPLYQKAIEFYKRSIEILPENAEATYNAGVCYYAIGDRENALKMYEQTLKYTPDYTNAANNSGVIYFERKDYENAKKYFEQALKYSPNNVDALGNIGAIYHNLGNFRSAVEYYRKALAINPANANVQANLARAESSLNGQK